MPLRASVRLSEPRKFIPNTLVPPPALLSGVNNQGSARGKDFSVSDCARLLSFIRRFISMFISMLISMFISTFISMFISIL